MELPGATQPSKDAMKQMVNAVDRKAFIELPNGHGAQLPAAVSVPGTDRRLPRESTPNRGGRRLGVPRALSGGGRSAAAPC